VDEEIIHGTFVESLLSRYSDPEHLPYGFYSCVEIPRISSSDELVSPVTVWRGEYIYDLLCSYLLRYICL